jgi:undecaprenyl pyrophosphate synthase
MATPSLRTVVHDSDNAVLRHVLVVGGTLAEWADLTDDAWLELIDDLGVLCSESAVRWLTLRPYESGVDGNCPPRQVERREVQVAGCQVIVDASADGRQRFADAMARLDAGTEVNEAAVAAMLYEPADSEPDLVVILGPSTQLPPSLVWELAYAELAFIPVAWSDLHSDAIAVAFDDFAVRRRRFGGLDDE